MPRKGYSQFGLDPRASAFGMRHVQTILMFLCLTVAYALRVNMSVAIVAMMHAEDANPDFPDFDWDESIKSLILSSFFWGYVITQIPAGQLAQKFGPKYLLFASVLICGIVCVLTPVAAIYGGYTAVIVTRVLQGLCQGFYFPSMHTMLAKWAPPQERGRLATFTYAGAQFGTVVSMPISGYLSSSSLGWPSVFYIMGGAAVLWSVLWFFLGANSPAEHKSIKEDEKNYIEDSLGYTAESRAQVHVTPWLSIFTSLPMWSLIIAHCGQNWGFWTLLTEMPSYMKDVLKFDIKKNSLLSALPYFVMWILSFVFSVLGDFIVNKNLLPVVVVRKLFNTIGHWVPAAALIGLGFVQQGQSDLAVGLLVLAVGINASTYLGFQVNHIDLSPNFAGTMMGITNGAANVMSILAPLIVGVVAPDTTSVEQWRTVFIISAAIYFINNLFFVLFGSAEVQPWNEPKVVSDAESPKDEKKTPIYKKILCNNRFKMC